jgi:ribonuclease P protein component
VSLSFPRSLRLLNKNQYDFVFQSAKRVGGHFFTVLYRKNMSEFPRMGLIVSKKTAKRAHDRNRFKRVMRQSFRVAQHSLPAVDIVILSRGKIEAVENPILFNNMEDVWRKISREVKVCSEKA